MFTSKEFERLAALICENMLRRGHKLNFFEVNKRSDMVYEYIYISVKINTRSYSEQVC